MSEISNGVHATFNQVLKSPATYMLMVAVSILWFFVMKFGGATDQVNTNCEAEKKELRADALRKDKRIENLTDAILYYRGVNTNIQLKADSLIRVKVGNESKDIVKNNK